MERENREQNKAPEKMEDVKLRMGEEVLLRKQESVVALRNLEKANTA